jgi:uncharacterized phage protein (TIGR02218 family)
MRAASVNLKARLLADSTSLCRLWRVTRRDGVIFRFTDSARPVTMMIAPDVTPQVYRSDVSFTSSAIFTSRSFANLQSVNMTFIMDPAGFAETDIRARLYDGANSELFVCDYNFTSYGVINMYAGNFGRITLSDQRVCSVEVVPADAAINGIMIGDDKYSQTCRNNLGDTRCKVDLDTFKVAFTVSSAAGGSIVAAAFTQANANWNLGFITWLTGPNTGSRSPVQGNDQASTSVFLLAAPFYPIGAGDTGYIYPGCDKLRQTCFTKFNNVKNMDAEPDVPTGAGLMGTNFAVSNMANIYGAPNG